MRRQAMTTLKCLQSVVNIQSQVCGKRTQIPGGAHRDYEDSNIFNENNLKVRIDLKRITLWKQCSSLLVRKKILCFQVDTNGPKRWDDSLLTKEEAEAVVMNKKEASMRRERIKEYAVTHRVSILYTC